MSTRTRIAEYAENFNNLTHYIKIKVGYKIQDRGFEIKLFAVDTGYLGTFFILDATAKTLTKEEFFNVIRNFEDILMEMQDGLEPI